MTVLSREQIIELRRMSGVYELTADLELRITPPLVAQALAEGFAMGVDSSHGYDLDVEDVRIHLLDDDRKRRVRKYAVHWEPTGTTVLLEGGPLDGQTVVLPAREDHLSGGWPSFEPVSAGDMYETATRDACVYSYAGYDTTSRCRIFRPTKVEP